MGTKGGFDKHPENAVHTGRPKESEAFRKLRKCTQKELLQTIAKVSDMTKKEAKAFLEEPEAKLLEVGLVTRLLKGDVDVILNRLLGMPKQTIDEKTDSKITVEIIKAEKKEEKNESI